MSVAVELVNGTHHTHVKMAPQLTSSHDDTGEWAANFTAEETHAVTPPRSSAVVSATKKAVIEWAVEDPLSRGEWQ